MEYVSMFGVNASILGGESSNFQIFIYFWVMGQSKRRIAKKNKILGTPQLIDMDQTKLTLGGWCYTLTQLVQP